MKKIFVSILLSLLSFAFAQRIGVLAGPSGIPCGKLIDQASSNKFDFEVYPSAQAELAKLIKGEIDIAFLPPNAAAKIYNSSGSIVCLGITGNINLYVMTKNKSVKTLKDLAGKTVACAGQGATPEYIFRYLLAKNGLKTSDHSKSKKAVTLDFSTPNPQIAASLIEGKFDFSLVPEPFATVIESKSPDVARAIVLQDELQRVEKLDSYPMTVLVANAKYSKANPEKIGKFIGEYAQANAWTGTNPTAAGILAPEAIGGKLPDEAFYY